MAAPYEPPRYPKTPWLCALEDLRPQGDPEMQAFLGRSVLLGLYVTEGSQRLGMLAIRWTNGPMSALIPQDGIDLDQIAMGDDGE